MSKTYIHHQGFVYGPVELKHKPPSWLSRETANWDLWEERILATKKYKWTGPELPDWSEVVEETYLKSIKIKKQ